jgi:sigma-E factor negative regulatory protein RseB
MPRSSVVRSILVVLAGTLASAQAAATNEAAGPATDARTPAQWIEFMSRAFAERSYDGILSYFDGEDLSTLRVVHAVVDGVEQERLVHMDGPMREIVRRDDDVFCILDPDDEILELESSIPAGPFSRAFASTLDEAADQYDLTLEGRDRVAGRAAVRILVAPRDHDRYAYRLWIDEGKGLLLRSDLLDADGGRLEIVQFTDIRIDEPIDPAALERASRIGAVTNRLTVRAEAPPPDVAASQWRLDWMPAGFAMAASEWRHPGQQSRALATQMYSDGLAAFSVFIEEMPAEGASNLVSRKGATVAVTHRTAGPDGVPHLVTVVGEVPTATAERVARAVRFAADE